MIANLSEQDLLKIVKDASAGRDFIRLSLEGSVLWRLRVAAGLFPIGRVYKSTYRRAGYTEIYLSRPRFPRGRSDIVPWVRASLYVPGILYTAFMLTLTARVVYHTWVDPVAIFQPGVIAEVICVLIMVSIVLDGRYALQCGKVLVPAGAD
jgi:hypothetical protein